MSKDTASVRIRIIGGIRAAKEAKTLADAMDELGEDTSKVGRAAVMATFGVVRLQRQMKKLARAETLAAASTWALTTSLLALKVVSLAVATVALPALAVALYNVAAAAAVWTVAMLGGLVAIAAGAGLMVAGVVGQFNAMNEQAGTAANRLAGAADRLKRKFLEVTASGADKFMDGLARGMDRIRPMLATLEPVFTRIGEAFGRMFDVLGKEIAGMGPQLRTMLGELPDVIRSAGDLLGSLLRLLISIGTVGAPLVSDALRTVAGWFDRLGASLTVDRLAAAQGTLRNFASGVKGFFAALADPLRGVLGPALDDFNGKWGDLAAASGRAIGQILAGLIKLGRAVLPTVIAVLDWFGQNAPAIFGWVANAARDVWKALEPAIPFVQNVLWPILSGVFRGIGDTLKVVFWVVRQVATAIGWIGDKAEAIKPYLDDFGRVLGWLFGGWVIKAIGTVVGAFGTFGRVVSPILSGIGSALQWIGNKIGAVGRIAGGLLGAISSSFSAVWEWLKGAASTAYDAAKGIGKAIVDGIIDFIKGSASSIAEAVTDVIPRPSLPGPLNLLGGGLGGAVSGLGGILGIGGNAAGGVITRPGYRWVGEEGPELVRFPRAATIYPAGQSRALAQSDYPQAPAAGGVVENHIHVIVDGREIGRAVDRFNADRLVRA